MKITKKASQLHTDAEQSKGSRCLVNIYLGLIVFCLILLLTAFGSTLCVDAASGIDLSQPGSLMLQYQYDGNALSGVRVRIYRVADISAQGEFTLISPYNDPTRFPVDQIRHVTDQTTWQEITKPIEAYVYTNGVAPTASGTTSGDGRLTFTDLTLGLYLVVSDTLEVPSENCSYRFDTYLTAIPELDEKGNWVSPSVDVIGVPKCEKINHPDGGRQTITYAVYKRWDDAGYEMLRPQYVVINIYRDGSLYATVQLSDSNGWAYSWSYEEGHSWSVSEAVSGDYMISETTSGNATFLYNRYRPGEVLGEDRERAEDGEVLGDSRLPQTGQLWWPMLPLILAGLCLIIVGSAFLRRGKATGTGEG